MPKVGIIVDGQGDHAAITKKFGAIGRVLKTDGPRGHEVSVEDIVGGSRRQVSMLQALRCEKIICLVDFEQRVVDFSAFVDRLNEAFRREFPGTNVVGCAANRMIENWYLADVLSLSKLAFIREVGRQKPYEGKHGKNEIKKIFAKGSSYNEVRHGPILLDTVDLGVARRNSSSFASFLDEIL
jgi:hypothetical protein